MLYTRKGDSGTSKTFDAKPGERLSKNSALFEALGTLDELNSFLGLCKVKSKEIGFRIKDVGGDAVVHGIQETLFIIQAHVAGADKKVVVEKVIRLEEITDEIEKILPPITTFFISGGTELAALFDVARTLARRTERRVVAVHESGDRNISPETLQYLNRLSSVLYALARLSNQLSGIKEESPQY